MLVTEYVFDYARRDPDRLCVVDEQGTFTYRRMAALTLRAADKLRELGIMPGDRIMVRCMQDAQFLMTDMACVLTGAVFVPLEKEAAPARGLSMAEDTEAVLYIGEELGELSCPQISFDTLFSGGECPVIPDSLVMPEMSLTAQILYTTGTTGKSKGIEITHANNEALAENVSEGTEMREGNVEFIPLPLSHSHGLRCCYANLTRGGTLVLADGMRNVRAIYEKLQTYHVTAMDLSPTAASVILRLFKKVLPQLNEQLDYIQIGTAPLSEQLKESLKAQFPDVRLYNFYGSTESGRSCVLNFNSTDDRKFCVGKPTKHARFIITDEQRCPIESDPVHTGLLACAGPMNMKGYFKQPELTASVMKDGYLFTSDEAWIDEQGFVYVLGRKDDVINYMGIKIAPEEIEEVAMASGMIADCACVPAPDPSAGQIPKLFYTPKDGDFDRNAFLRFLEERIDSNKYPKQIQPLESIPRTANGKLQRKKLIGL